MLNIIGGKTDQYDYDDVLNLSSSIENIWLMLEQSYDIGRKGIQFLELQNIKYEKSDSPVKFYKKVYHLVMDNLYKRGETFNCEKVEENEKMTPTFLNFVMFYVLEKIDARLVKEIKNKWGHVLDSNKSLHEMKDIILKGVPDILSKLEEEESQLSAFTGANKEGRNDRFKSKSSYGPQKGKRNFERRFCRLCQAAGVPKRMYTSHNISSCSRWTKKDVEDLRYMMCEMAVDPEDFENSDSDE